MQKRAVIEGVRWYNNRPFLAFTSLSKIPFLQFRFEFSSLRLFIDADKELPVITKRKMLNWRHYPNGSPKNHPLDTHLIPSPTIFSLGTFDWWFNSKIQNQSKPYFQVRTSPGGTLMDGEIQTSIFLNTNSKFDWRQQYYFWRRLFDENTLIRQLSIGKINTPSISSLTAPLVGIHFSNIRRNDYLFPGKHRLLRFGEPGQQVELLINNQLAATTLADSYGFIRFDMPIQYGLNQLTIRFKNSDGSIKEERLSFNFPVFFAPPGTFNYHFTAGVLEDGAATRFTKMDLNYGVSSFFSLNGGFENLSSFSPGKEIVYLKGNYRLTNDLFIQFGHSRNVSSSIEINWHPGNLPLFVVGQIKKYDDNQEALFYNYREERKLSLSLPFSTNKLNLYSRLSIHEVILGSSRYTTAEAMLNFLFKRSSLQFSGFGLTGKERSPYIFGNLQLQYYLPRNIQLSTRLQVDFSNLELVLFRIESALPLSNRGYFRGFYESNFKSHFRSLQVGIQYFLPYMQASHSLRSGTFSSAYLSSLQGSLLFDRSAGYVEAKNTPSNGRGGLILTSFLDENNNRKQDKGEPNVDGLRFNITPGHGQIIRKKHTSVVRNLNADRDYFLDIPNQKLNNIAFDVPETLIKVRVLPNQLSKVRVPVRIVGEISGRVYLLKGFKKQVQSRIILNIFNEDGERVGQTISNADGEFSLLGLTSGNYYILPDEQQLEKIQMTTVALSPGFSLENRLTGAYKQGILVILKENE